MMMKEKEMVQGLQQRFPWNSNNKVQRELEKSPGWWHDRKEDSVASLEYEVPADCLSPKPYPLRVI